MLPLGRLPFLFIAHQAPVAGHGRLPDMPARTTLRLTSPVMAGCRIHGPLLCEPALASPQRALSPAGARRGRARSARVRPPRQPAPRSPRLSQPRVSRRSGAEAGIGAAASFPGAPRARGGATCRATCHGRQRTCNGGAGDARGGGGLTVVTAGGEG